MGADILRRFRVELSEDRSIAMGRAAIFPGDVVLETPHKETQDSR
jgi:hypothetical protein